MFAKSGNGVECRDWLISISNAVYSVNCIFLAKKIAITLWEGSMFLLLRWVYFISCQFYILSRRPPGNQWIATNFSLHSRTEQILQMLQLELNVHPNFLPDRTKLISPLLWSFASLLWWLCLETRWWLVHFKSTDDFAQQVICYWYH